VVSALAPIVAAALAVAALAREPRVPVNWLTFAAAGAVLVAEVLLFLSSRWL
jgi:hypothetical protein